MTTPPLLDVASLGITLNPPGGPPRQLVRDIHFTAPPGGIVALVGESGSGKTLVGRAIMGLLAPQLQVASGDIRFNGRSLTSLTQNELRDVRGDQIGMVFQEPMVSLNPAMRIGAQMTEALLRHKRMNAHAARDLSLDMLRRVGIIDPVACFNGHPAQFSGGMRQRIMLASVLAMRPRLLIADEPTTALDAVMRRQVMEMMVDLTREIGTAVLLISHDLGMVSQYADHVVVMRRGEQIEQGAPQQILLDPGHDYTRGLLGSLPMRPDAADPVHQDGPLVAMRDLSVTYPGHGGFLARTTAPKRAVIGATLDIYPGETLAVVGESGSGKSTIGRALLKLGPPMGGSATFAGEDVAALSGAALANFRRRTQMIFQDPNSSLDPRMRLDAIVAEGLRTERGLSNLDRLTRARAILAEVGLPDDFARRFPHELSGGQRQRVCIARAIVGQPDFIVADEAVSALDVTVQAQVLNLLASLQKRYGFAILFISHDLGVVEQIADRVAVMYRGHIVELGTREDVFDRPHHPYTRTLLAATPRIGRRPEGGYALIDPILADAEPPIAGSRLVRSRPGGAGRPESCAHRRRAFRQLRGLNAYGEQAHMAGRPPLSGLGGRSVFVGAGIVRRRHDLAGRASSRSPADRRRFARAAAGRHRHDCRKRPRRASRCENRENRLARNYRRPGDHASLRPRSTYSLIQAR